MTCGSSSSSTLSGSRRLSRLSLKLGERVALVVLLLCIGCTCSEEDGTELPAVGKEWVGEFAAGESKRFFVVLEAGEYLHTVVEQRGVDLIITFFDPTGQPLLEIDSPNSTSGPEHLWVIAARSGKHHIRLHASTGSGRYIARTLARREPEAEDFNFARAAQALAKGNELHKMGTPDACIEALEYCEKSLAQWQQLDEPLQEAITLTQIGLTWVTLKKPDRAIESYRNAWSLLQSSRWKHSHQSVALNNWLGLAYQENLDLSSAVDAFKFALEIAEKVGDSRGAAVALTNIALASTLQGQAQEAFEYYERALSIWRDLDDEENIIQALINTGYHYIVLGQIEEARDYLAQAEKLAGEEGLVRQRAKALVFLGRTHYLRDELTQALDFYSRALMVNASIDDPSALIGVLDHQGTAYLKLGRITESIACFEQALEIAEKLNKKIDAAHTQTNLSRAHARLGDFEKSLHYFEQALATFEISGQRHGEASALYVGAEVERLRGDLEQARLYMERVIEIVESNRVTAVNQDWRVSYLEYRQRYYEFYIDLLIELASQTPESNYVKMAFEAAERTQARSLLDLLNEAGAGIREGVPPALLQREHELRDRLNDKALEYYHAQRDGADSELLAELDRQLADLTREEEYLEVEIRKASPAFAALDTSETVGVHQIQHDLLDENSLLLVYKLGSERSFLWAVNTTSIKSYELPGRGSIENAAKQLHENLRNSSASGPRMQARLAATALSDVVLKPVAEHLHRRLVIIADGALHYIPFGVLPPPVSDSDYMVNDHEIVYLPSASVLATLRQRSKEDRPLSRGLVAAFADPVFTAEDARVKSRTWSSLSVDPRLESSLRAVQRSARSLGLKDFPRLLHSRHEAEAIVGLVSRGSSRIALDFEATRSLAKSGELAHYRFIHFATHGVLHAEHPELSGIVLSMVDEEGNAIDGFFRSHELYDLRLTADLVVLSACQTALGREVRGEGLLGLTRGFFYAGAPRVVVSLWSIDDEATAELMKRFYQGVLVERLSPADALRKAQNWMIARERWSAPAYWAGFVLQGEWR